MQKLIENANPKRNPVTSVIGGVFLLISAAMYIVKYIVPAFFVLKQEIPYEWYGPIIPLALGVLLAFLNDEYFARIFNRGDKILAKRTETADKIVDEIQITKTSTNEKNTP